MNQPTVSATKTMTETWEVKKKAAGNAWSVKSTIVKFAQDDEVTPHDDATTGVEYECVNCADRGVKFTITAGGAAFVAGDTFEFKTRRKRENEVEKESDQSQFSKPVGLTP